jgi:hypothetical protein
MRALLRGHTLGRGCAASVLASETALLYARMLFPLGDAAAPTNTLP